MKGEKEAELEVVKETLGESSSSEIEGRVKQAHMFLLEETLEITFILL